MAKQVNLSKQQRTTGFATGTFAPPKAVAMPQPNGPQMPFPPGAILREFKPTPAEQAVLEQYEWKPGDPVPDNLADLRAAAIKEAQRNLPLPVPVDTPPLTLPAERSIDSLTPDAQAEIIAAIKAAKQADVDAQRIRRMQIEDAPPGVNEAIEAAAVVDDREETTYAGTNVAKRTSLTGARLEKTHCDHCGHDLSQPSVADPTDEDKFVFVQSVLGGVPFSKTVRAFGDRLLVTARTLSVAEVDLCHKQVYLEKELGEVVTPFDVTETVMRYRLCLQLQQIRGAGMEFDLPDSIEGWKKALADAGSETVLKSTSPEGRTITHTPLRAIKAWLDENVFRTETMIRLVSVIIADLNRLTVKLEANYLNTDFWKGTAV